MNHLVPCPDCRRHVRAHESSCPFCDAALSFAATPAPALPKRRLGRAALFAFGATLVGATALGCSSDDDDTGSGGAAGSGGTAGASGSGGSAGDDSGAAGQDSGIAGGGQALYGAPSP